MKDLTKHWDGVPKGWRHITSKMNDAKKQMIIDNFNNFILPFIDKSKVSSSIDWGCGGGLLTKELKKFSWVTALDISSDSLNSCISFASPDDTYKLPDNLSNFNYSGVTDLILAHEVIWHFPNFKYFKEVVKIWTNRIKPIYICINTKNTSDGYTEVDNYKKDYLKSLCVSDDVVINIFDELNYKLVSSKIASNGRIPKTYFVFIASDIKD